MKTVPATWFLKSIRKTFPQGESHIAVLHGVDLVLHGGQTLAISGPSGSGKSTLLNIIGGLDSPTSGEVRYGDRSIHAMPDREKALFRSKTIGFVFQDHHLLPQLTVLENVLLPTLPLAVHDPTSEQRARALLDRLGLAHRMAAFPATLSGGERQRVAMARALINQPRLLLCDEPTGNLDTETARSVIREILALANGNGSAVIMATHNLEHASRFRRQLHLQSGVLQPAPHHDGPRE